MDWGGLLGRTGGHTRDAFSVERGFRGNEESGSMGHLSGQPGGIGETACHFGHGKRAIAGDLPPLNTRFLRNGQINFFQIHLGPLHILERVLRMDDDKATEQPMAGFDAEIKTLLRGDENDRQKAGDALLREFGIRLMGKLRSFFWLTDAEKGSVIHDTVLEVLKIAGRAELDLDRPLAGLLLRICQCKAIDLSRQKRRATGRDDELTEEIADALIDTKVGLAWKDAISKEDAPAIRGEFCEFVQDLPSQQKLVAGVLASHFGWALSHKEIVRKIYETTGSEMSETAVKGALSQIRQKFKAVLKFKYPELPL
jgi:hypothetical protein